jgi:hypothetical protein
MPLVTPATSGAIGPALDDVWLWSNQWNKRCQGKPKYAEKTSSSTRNLTWLGLGQKPGHRYGKPATNSLICGTAIVTYIKTIDGKVKLKLSL